MDWMLGALLAGWMALGWQAYNLGRRGRRVRRAERQLSMHGARQERPDRGRLLGTGGRQRDPLAGKLEADLAGALERSQFELHYQPLANLHGRLIGFEALLRWVHPELGMLAPGQFLSQAETGGLIGDIGRWVLLQACEQSGRLAGETPLTISVNLGARQWLAADLVDQVLECLRLTGADPARLELELTESLLTRDLERTGERMRRLGELGVRFAIDDVGTGCLSLPILEALPVHALKIDRSLVASLEERAGAYATVKAIIALARPLGLMVVAEGVETPGQLSILTALGCDRCQGFLIGRPEPLP